MRAEEITESFDDDEEKMKQAIDKRGFHVVDRITNYRGEPAYLVIFFEKGKVKLAKINQAYRFRYGPDVFATIKPNGNYPWFKSNSDRDAVDSEIIDAMRNGSYVDYPLLDVDELTVEW